MMHVVLPFLAAASMYTETLYPGTGIQSFTVDEVICEEKTEHQDLLIFENKTFGRVLALDGVIQLTEVDQAIYHEMMAHVPILEHGEVRSVLIVGGGDGGLLREVVKIIIQRVVVVDIDPDVVAMSKKYLPKLSDGAFDDPRAEVIIQDAAQYVKNCEEQFDVIISDSTDPFGPAQVLFSTEFYADCKALLRKGGIFVNQSGVPFVQSEEFKLTLKNQRPNFKYVTFYIAPVPTYVGGHMAFGFASDKKRRISEATLELRAANLKAPLFTIPLPFTRPRSPCRTTWFRKSNDQSSRILQVLLHRLDELRPICAVHYPMIRR